MWTRPTMVSKHLKYWVSPLFVSVQMLAGVSTEVKDAYN